MCNGCDLSLCVSVCCVYACAYANLCVNSYAVVGFEHVMHLITIIINLIPLLFNQLKLSDQTSSSTQFPAKREKCEQMNVNDAIIDFHVRANLYVSATHEHNSQLNSKQHAHIDSIWLASSTNARPGLLDRAHDYQHTYLSICIVYHVLLCCCSLFFLLSSQFGVCYMKYAAK